MLSVKIRKKTYGNLQVLNKINLDLVKGRVTGIVGRNGAGKSTLFKCIAGLVDFDGEIISEYDKLKNHLGFLYTDPVFMSRITGWEYLKLLVSARGIDNDSFESQNIFNLPLNQYADNYSSGMKKKLALTGILLQKNDMFILDEPFNGVDVQSNIIITEIIKKLKSLNKTILISSHIFSSLTRICDEIHLIDQGSIIKSANPDEYADLEQEMIDKVIPDVLDRLPLE